MLGQCFDAYTILQFSSVISTRELGGYRRGADNLGLGGYRCIGVSVRRRFGTRGAGTMQFSVQERNLTVIHKNCNLANLQDNPQGVLIGPNPRWECDSDWVHGLQPRNWDRNLGANIKMQLDENLGQTPRISNCNFQNLRQLSFGNAG